MAEMPKGARRVRGGGDMAAERGREHVETLVSGGGEAGLSMGYQLSRRALPYKIVDANPRIGDVRRNRWDSFRLSPPTDSTGFRGWASPDTAGGSPARTSGPITSSPMPGSSTFSSRRESGWRN